MHVYYKDCRQSFLQSCNCAVAINVDDDVIVIDRCGPHEDKHHHIKVILFINGELSPSVRIFHIGQTHQIILSSGTSISVIISVFSPFVDIHITPSSLDWKNTEGLCGTFNGNVSDDFRLPNGTITNNANHFGDSWK